MAFQTLLAVTIAISFTAHSACGDRVRLEGDQQLAGRRSEWKKVGEAPDNAKHTLVFALTQSNLAELEKKLMSVSTPSNAEYGKFLSAAEVDAFVRPSAESVDAVSQWLSESDVSVEKACRFTRAREFLECDVNIGQARALLDVPFYRYELDSAVALRAAGHYTVPATVASHLDFVGGVHRLPATGHKVANTSMYRIAKTQGLLGVIPSSLRELYKVGSAVGAGEDSKNVQSVAQFLDQHYRPEDLETFMKKYAGGFTHMTKVAKEIGPDTGHGGIEASLDIQYIMSLGANVPTWFYSTAGKHEGQEPFLLWIQAVANSTTLPNVISVSYGDDEDTLSTLYMQRVSVEFQKLGVRGVSILFASGDDGAGCHKQVFRPNFPASSPYVTTVGGTVESSETEMGVSFSSGGFSNVFAPAAYQSKDVAEFLSTSTKLPEQRFFNKSGRGYPDVAALAVGFEVVDNGFTTPASGTSCAAPTFGGIVGLLNDKLVNEHAKTPLGFLNPFLYEQGFAALTDITGGCNEGCSGKGFCADKGWDPVTGLGTPLYDALLAQVLKAKRV